MCMKDHRLYRPKDLTKKELEFLAKQARREMIIAFTMVVLGAVLITLLFKLTLGAIDAV